MSSSLTENMNQVEAKKEEDVGIMGDVDSEGRRVSFWSFFREAGNVPLSELLRREEEETNKALPAIAAKPVERKNKGLSIRAPSFFTKKKPVATKIVQKVERNEEEKEEE